MVVLLYLALICFVFFAFWLLHKTFPTETMTKMNWQLAWIGLGLLLLLSCWDRQLVLFEADVMKTLRHRILLNWEWVTVVFFFSVLEWIPNTFLADSTAMMTIAILTLLARIDLLPGVHMETWKCHGWLLITNPNASMSITSWWLTNWTVSSPTRIGLEIKKKKQRKTYTSLLKLPSDELWKERGVGRLNTF